MQITGFKDSSFSLRYLGVPITAGRLTKNECTKLVEKILAGVRIWATKSLSFAGRARLISSVIFGMYACWATIFILPNTGLDKITQICRNYLWSGSKDAKRKPHISWVTTCLSKSQGGLGIKDFGTRNKALIAKLVKWIHGKYLKSNSWWSYHPPKDCSWYKRKICFIKELFKEGSTSPPHWNWLGKPEYTVSIGYKWLMGDQRKVTWARIPWTRTVILRHGFIVWVLLQHRLPTKAKLSKYITDMDTLCPLCHQAIEEDSHLFYDCEYAKEIWGGHKPLVGLPGEYTGVYYIWRARNVALFKQTQWATPSVVKEIKEQIKTRILFLHSISARYSLYIDRLLSI
ncbi:hypothetical protein Cgig2_022665 [Carnegiea gigantea]|uniref:Reverse transcriptase zinc-binding domain-containing protein n=1 Tax=Carnegiea gigantea TaxID=171969 RepID=A0A9Q1GQ40_9CARY|nr:hypothetical protein Cgig2_022665 [Carnegiea gigantea]